LWRYIESGDKSKYSSEGIYVPEHSWGLSESVATSGVDKV